MSDQVAGKGPSVKPIEVVAAAFVRPATAGPAGEGTAPTSTLNREILLFRRAKHDRGTGFWECPGGKIEPGETEEQALCREIQEELGVGIKILRFVGDNTHVYDGKTIHLKLYECQLLSENFVLTDHDAFAWVTKENLSNYPLSAVDIPLVESVLDV